MNYDIEDNPIFALEQRLFPDGEKVFQMKFDCRAGKFLRATPAENFTIEARFTGVGSYVNIMTDGLDVSAYAGQRKTFDIKIIGSDVTFAVENTTIQIKS